MQRSISQEVYIKDKKYIPGSAHVNLEVWFLQGVQVDRIVAEVVQSFL